MTFIKEYFLPRLLQWLVVIVIGVTIAFLIPRLSPFNPVDQVVSRVTAFQSLAPEASLALREALLDLYGLEGNTFEQYINFWKRVVQGDLGPSFSAFPTPVTTIIANGLPWTIGLLGSSLLISWVLGIILGTLAGYYPNRVWSQILDKMMVTIYPIPYFILALVLVLVFAYYIPIFPLVGGASGRPALSLAYYTSVLRHAFLPALSLILLGTAFRFIIAKALSSTLISSDYVSYAETAGLAKRTIIFGYVMRNSMLPHITDLGLSLGALFEGALITEVVFSYPGIGFYLYTAILQADFNLIMGITLFSIVGIATAVLIVDLLYPLIDPRIRYR